MKKTILAFALVASFGAQASEVGICSDKAVEASKALNSINFATEKVLEAKVNKTRYVGFHVVEYNVELGTEDSSRGYKVDVLEYNDPSTCEILNVSIAELEAL